MPARPAQRRIESNHRWQVQVWRLVERDDDHVVGRGIDGWRTRLRNRAHCEARRQRLIAEAAPLAIVVGVHRKGARPG